MVEQSVMFTGLLIAPYVCGLSAVGLDVLRRALGAVIFQHVLRENDFIGLE